MTCAHRQQLLFLAALLLAAAAGPHSAQGRDIGDTAGDWIDWIKVTCRTGRCAAGPLELQRSFARLASRHRVPGLSWTDDPHPS